ncbi:MAG: amidohydrolase family protein [Verrucomicrobia bacterium]|nr:amidohydrolase family protein [Verrucomicrobiota bacterium]MBU1734548.1 amidohydrolase family protein [Verrucomicrobiota bacterium]MBU1856617.1 amidohydrolase family protein [Verrucomicrobiota bacterium]
MIIDSAVCLAGMADSAPTKAWLDQMARHAITHAVVAPADGYAAVYNEEGNALLARLVRRYPKQLSGLAVANPWLGTKAVGLLEKAFDDGLMGLFLCPPRQGFRLTESIVDPLLEVCCRRHKPVYAHTGTPICSEPFQLAELARRFPEVTFIMGHAAYPDFWYDVAGALQQAPNLLVETSCQVAAIIQQALDAVGPERVLFGSGWPRSKPGVEILKIRSMGLADDIFEKVMHTNAANCWGLKP